jgi:hypothetical protein
VIPAAAPERAVARLCIGANFAVWIGLVLDGAGDGSLAVAGVVLTFAGLVILITIRDRARLRLRALAMDAGLPGRATSTLLGCFMVAGLLGLAVRVFRVVGTL